MLAPQSTLRVNGNFTGHQKSKRELIDTCTEKRYVKRKQDGTFKESVNVGRSRSADSRSKPRTVAKLGYGDQGDASRPVAKKAAKKSTQKAA